MLNIYLNKHPKDIWIFFKKKKKVKIFGNESQLFYKGQIIDRSKGKILELSL